MNTVVKAVARAERNPIPAGGRKVMEVRYKWLDSHPGEADLQLNAPNHCEVCIDLESQDA